MEEDKELQFKLKQEWSDLKVWAEEEIKKALPEARVPKTTWEWLSLTCLQVDIFFERPWWHNSWNEEGRWVKSTLGIRLRCGALNKYYNLCFKFTTKDTKRLQEKVIAKIQALNDKVLQEKAAAETKREKENENYRLQKEEFANINVPYNFNLKRRFNGNYDFRYTDSDLTPEKAKAIIVAIQDIMLAGKIVLHNE